MAAKGEHETARQRRLIAIEAMGRELDPSDPASSAGRLRDQFLNGRFHERPMVISGDIDGLASAMMLASVAPTAKVVSVVVSESKNPGAIWIHPDHPTRPDNLLGIDVFSLGFDNIGNHVVLYGPKQLRRREKLGAFQSWDKEVRRVAKEHLFAVPNLWAEIGACYEDAQRPRSARYKYPLGTAQVLLALLEAVGQRPKFFDRRYLPWLIANCDGGVSSFYRYTENVSLWWSTMAAAVGPGTNSDHLYRLVSEMKPQDFKAAVDSLARELQADGLTRFLTNDWNLEQGATKRPSPMIWREAVEWIRSLTGWPDPFLDGVEGISKWTYVASARGVTHDEVSLDKKHDEVRDPAVIRAGWDAVNVNFYMGGRQEGGSRFNWVAGWN